MQLKHVSMNMNNLSLHMTEKQEVVKGGGGVECIRTRVHSERASVRSLTVFCASMLTAVEVCCTLGGICCTTMFATPGGCM